MKKLLFFFLAFFGVLISSPFVMAKENPIFTPPTIPALWRAHPPIHIQSQIHMNVPTGYTPNQIRTAYGFDKVPSSGTGQTIAIVDAYDAPSVTQDLERFIQTFHLKTLYGLPTTAPCTILHGPHPCFQKIYPGNKPLPDTGWALEAALDTQWAHAIAPDANILLVEAQNSSLKHLLAALDLASSKKPAVVSMSWGGSEFRTEHQLDTHFNHAGIMYIASSGDNGNGVLFPAVSSRVLAVGGTHLPLDTHGHATEPETAWSGSGGGISAYIAQPLYQKSLPILDSTKKRSLPDVAYNADPETGYAVYSSYPQPGWSKIGGTSAAAPQWAALIAIIDQLRGSSYLSSTTSRSPFYLAASPTHYALNYQDILSGKNGNCSTYCQARPGYDFVTGLGSPHVPHLIEFLVHH